MSNTQNFLTSKPKGSLNVCNTPPWLLKFKGKLDSRKGEGVCNEFILALLKKEALLETNEIISAESYLGDTRKAGASALIKLSGNKLFINNVPQKEEDTSPQAIRANRTNSSKLLSERNMAETAISELSQINETITSIDTILTERIEKLRNLAAEKCHIYISGIRAGKLPDYESSIVSFSDNSLEIYHAKHSALDSKIHGIVMDSMKEAVA